WLKLENYLHDHSGVEVTHSLCPHCVKELYPDFYESITKAGE
ncbi:MAG: response regulator, partial [bacterium]|nr:response regulator [bacterium]